MISAAIMLVTYSLRIPPCTEYTIFTYYMLVYPVLSISYGFYHLATIPSFSAAFQSVTRSLSIPPCTEYRISTYYTLVYLFYPLLRLPSSHYGTIILGSLSVHYPVTQHPSLHKASVLSFNTITPVCH